jgi:hypothetical protein
MIRFFSICLCAMVALTATIASAQRTPAPAELSKCHYNQKRASRSVDATPFKLEWDFTNTSAKVETEVDVTLYVARADDEAATGLTYQQKGSFAPGVLIKGDIFNSESPYRLMAGRVACRISHVVYADGTTWSGPAMVYLKPRPEGMDRPQATATATPAP